MRNFLMIDYNRISSKTGPGCECVGRAGWALQRRLQLMSPAQCPRKASHAEQSRAEHKLASRVQRSPQPTPPLPSLARRPKSRACRPSPAPPLAARTRSPAGFSVALLDAVLVPTPRSSTLCSPSLRSPLLFLASSCPTAQVRTLRGNQGKNTYKPLIL